MRYQVTAGYVTVETSVDGPSRARIDIPRGAELPTDVSDAECEALLQRGDIAPADEEPEAGEPVDDPDAVPAGTIQNVLDWVAGDKDKAGRALDVEQAAGQPRSTLINQLQQLIAAE